MLRRHPVAAFLLLAFPLSWYPWVLALLRGTTTGPNPLGPLVAALLVTAAVDGRAGLRPFLGSLVRWRVGARWYAVAFLLPVALCAAAGAGAMALGAQAPTLDGLPGWREIADRFLFVLLFVGLGEEPGWRGFLLPRLQARASPLRSTLIVAAAHAAWHLPLFGTEFPLHVLPAFLISLAAGAVVLTWMFNRTGGSVLLPMLLHASLNVAGPGVLFPLFPGADLARLWWALAAAWAAAAVAVLAGGGLDPANGRGR